jgi:hypothetical protein
MIRQSARRALTAILLIAGAAMLQACVYDPYAGGYVPCCAYPAYGAYGYPAYGGVVVEGGGGYYHGGYGGGHWGH